MKAKISLVILLFFSCIQLASAQSSVNGIVCVTTGVEYEYTFNAGWDSTASIQVCVSGGIISANNSNCITASGITSVKITWNDKEDNGKIKVTYPKGSMAKNVYISPALNGGGIDSIRKTQIIDFQKTPKDLECSQSKGGNCNTNYSYQWQQSSDIVNWKDMVGQQNKSLKFSSGLTEPTYFRRKVIEKNSGSIAYSDVAVVFVNPKPQ